MRVRVKICGITRPEDGVVAARHGADAIGLVFHPRSPRFVAVETAQAIVEQLPPFVTVVGLFVDASIDRIRSVLDQVPIDMLQFHGDEPPETCAAFGKPYIKAVAMREGTDPLEAALRFSDARGLLLDAYREGVPGGTGESFDWERVPSNPGKPLILAGGLNPDNVGEAIRRVRPYAVDVSSGVERDKGIKDEQRIIEFLRGVSSVQTI
jgi:phosphoribosylanthranilate isomerase